MAKTPPSNKRAGRSSASSGSRDRVVEKKIRKILGASSRAALDAPILETANRARLLDICRLLDLRGTSRLRKAELVDRLLQALRAEKAPSPKERSRTTRQPQVRPKTEGETRPSAPVAAAPSPEHTWSRAEFQSRRFALDRRAGSSSPSASRSSLPKYIPWGYGRPRVGALPVDPDRLFVYWEVTDEAVEEARRALGTAGTDAWLNLRLYDTTGRLFDGTNARSFFDQGIGNGSRQWFFEIGKPGSEAFVEIGLRSRDGRFQNIARSGRVVFPRRSPAAFREPEWLTVRASTSEKPVWAASPARPAGSRDAWGTPQDEFLPPASAPAPGPGPEPEEHRTFFELGPWSTELTERTFEGSEEWRFERTWQGPVSTTTWESGPFSVPLEIPESVWETHGGEARTFRVDGRTHVVYGPWQMVVRGIGAYGGKCILSRWMIYRSWAVQGTGELKSTGSWARRIGSSALLGGSERRFGAASELRLQGASELLYRGASERRFGGASERVYAAASEKLMAGASGRGFRGASERRLGGASERRLAGASERRLGGASEQRLGGASERWPSRTSRTAPDE